MNRRAWRPVWWNVAREERPPIKITVKFPSDETG
jgi:hypothetical protein